MEDKEEIHRLAEEFEGCQKILLALGDENRQHMILEMMPHSDSQRRGNPENAPGRNKELLLF